MGRLVEVGAQVVTASWRVTPDKYEGPREFDDYVKALRYSEETSGRYVVARRSAQSGEHQARPRLHPAREWRRVAARLRGGRQQFDFVGGGEPTWSDVPGLARIDVLEGEK